MVGALGGGERWSWKGEGSEAADRDEEGVRDRMPC